MQTLRPTRAFPRGFVAAIVCLAAVFVAGAWSFVVGSGYIGLVLGVATFFAFITLGIPFALWRVSHAHHDGAARAHMPNGRSFGDWLKGDVEIWRDRMSGASALVTALLPLGAVALGAVAFAIAFQVASR